MKKHHRVTAMTICIITLMVSITAAPIFSALPSSSDVSSVTNEKQFSTEALTMNVRQTAESIFLNVHLNPFYSKPLLINGAQYQQIRLMNEPVLQIQGKPALPTISRSLCIPDTADMDVKILSTTIEEYHDVVLAPSKGNLLRNIDPETVPYQFDDMYMKDQWFPEQIITLGEPYILRDYRGQTLAIIPFQYNPVRKTLRFFSEISLEVFPAGESQTNTLSRITPPKTVNTYFSDLYKRQFLNYDLIGDAPREDEGTMLIITYDEFWQEMVPFAEWKTQQGIETKIVNISTIGDAEAIKNYISSYYHSHNLAFVLLAGDAQQIPTLFIGDIASDPSYSYIMGTDHDPDVFIGRFSAQTIDQLKTQVNRTLVYEKYPQMDATWYQNGMGIASDLGPGDDNEYDWEHIRTIRSDLLNYTYLSVDELYDGSHGGGDAPGNPTASMVRDVLNTGRGIVNYCGHGSSSSWGTTSFNVNDVNNLMNVHMLPFIFSVACYNGEFASGTCFAEAWLRAQYNGQPTGAIAAFMSSKSQSWNPPMEAQDEINYLLVNNEKNTIGGLCVGGCIQMNNKYGYEGDQETDAWHIFGDPSLQIRTDVPRILTVFHAPTLPYDNSSIDVKVTGGNNSLCTISYGMSLFGAASINEAGIAHIVFDHPLPYGYTVLLTVTGYNEIPYSASIELTGVDTPPIKPLKPSGPSFGIVSRNSSFSAKTTDPEGHSILYQFDFGDGILSDWIGPNESGQPCSITHQWVIQGRHSVRVRAQDVYGFSSDWSDPLEILVIKGRFINLLLTFLEKFAPRLYQILLDIIER